MTFNIDTSCFFEELQAVVLWSLKKYKKSQSLLLLSIFPSKDGIIVRQEETVAIETQEKQPRIGQSRNTSVTRINEEYVTQVSEEIEFSVNSPWILNHLFFSPFHSVWEKKNLTPCLFLWGIWRVLVSIIVQMDPKRSQISIFKRLSQKSLFSKLLSDKMGPITNLTVEQPF